MTIPELRRQLIAYNEAYRKGEPLVTDVEYDGLVDELRRRNPDDEFFVFYLT